MQTGAIAQLLTLALFMRHKRDCAAALIRPRSAHLAAAQDWRIAIAAESA